MEFMTVNPATEQQSAAYSAFSQTQVVACIESAHEAFQTWRTTDFAYRKRCMMKLSELLKEKKEDLAILMANEMGKPVTAGASEIEKCALVCEHYANHAEDYLKSREIKTNMKQTKICYKPLGIIFAIMPWNFPFWQVFRFAAPNLMAGNVAILKHAPICFGSGNQIAELFVEAGFPNYVFQHMILDDGLSKSVIEHPLVRGVTLTGSDTAGKIVGKESAHNLKKVVLELGGNDPYIVLADADLELAAEQIVISRMNNTGQVCIAAKRIIAVDEVCDALTGLIQEKLKHYVMGNPLDKTTNFGPMARKDLRDTLHNQVLSSIKQGAELKYGGAIPNQPGYYYPPTLLTHVQPGMPAFDDELFGPVVSIIRAESEQQAIQLANQSRYGLAAAVFTRDEKRGEHIATHEIEAGSCFVNAYVASDPRVPFGGIKNSGYGRELSKEGIIEFMNTKTISIQ